MKTVEFQKLLFKAAISVMSVDGEIHDTEINEITTIVKNSAYFFDFDFDNALSESIASVKLQGKDSINAFLNSLSVAELNPKQELILIEVLLKIIEADNEVNENELKLLHLVKSRIKTDEVTLLSNFPKYLLMLLDSKKFGSHDSFDNEIIVA